LKIRGGGGAAFNRTDDDFPVKEDGMGDAKGFRLEQTCDGSLKKRNAKQADNLSNGRDRNDPLKRPRIVKRKGLQGDLCGGELHAEIGRANETIAWIHEEITRVNESIAGVNHEIAKVESEIASVNQEIGVVVSKIEVAERNVMDPYISKPNYWLKKEKQLREEKKQLREKEKQLRKEKKLFLEKEKLYLQEERQLREKERQLLGIFDDKGAWYGNLVLKTNMEGIENMKCDDHASTDRTHRCYVSFLE